MPNEILLVGNIVGSVFQPLYFSLFLIFTKNIKNKRILFISIMIIEHFILKYVCNINYDINFELFYTILSFLVLKLIYKDKARITDSITFIISVILLGIISMLVGMTVGMNIVGLAVSNILPIIIIYILRHKLSKIDVFYDKFWNRHNNKKMIKSITIRGISTVLTIITFVMMHFWMIYGIFIVRR